MWSAWQLTLLLMLPAAPTRRRGLATASQELGTAIKKKHIGDIFSGLFSCFFFELEVNFSRTYT